MFYKMDVIDKEAVPKCAYIPTKYILNILTY